MTLRDCAQGLYNAGLNVLPAIKSQKRPVGAWKQHTERRPAFEDAFPPNLQFDAICVVCGKTSGGLEIIDFDQQAKLFPAWQGLVGDHGCNLVVERSQSGGKHVAFRSASCSRNQKLAKLKDGTCAIETRGEGGICIIAPTNGYELESGSWEHVRNVTDDDRNILLASARALSEIEEVKPLPVATKTSAVTLPSSIYNESASDYMRRIEAGKISLQRAGWVFLRDDSDWEYWRRPGQTVPDKHGATFSKRDKYFHVFTSNAAPFEVDKTYSHLQIVALLDFNGDERAAALEWSRQSRFPRTINVIETFNEYDLPPEQTQTVETENKEKNKVVFPERLYNVGGLLQEIQNLTNDNAIRPQPEGAFLGALADMSFLCGRSIALNYHGTCVTPNIYALFLAPSGMGKEIIRRVGSEIARAYAPGESVPESFASVQALQNLISRVRKVYWLHDEFGRDLAVMNQTKANANITGVITESLKLYSNANNRAYLPKIIAQEAKGAKHVDPVDRPSLTIFATGNPREFFDATSETILNNGYISRFTTIQGRAYSEKKDVTFEEAQDASVFTLPLRLRSRIKQWSDMESRAVDNPIFLKFDHDAFDCLMSFDQTTEREIKTLSATDGGSTEFKARLFEKLWKYALLFSASKYGPTAQAVVDLECAEHAVALVTYESDVFDLNQDKFASNTQSRFMQDVLEWSRTQNDGFFTKSQYTRKFQRRGSLRERDEVLHSLIEAEYIVVVEVDGRKGFRIV